MVMIPTRHRRELAERCLDSFRETAADADIVLVTDDDDEDYAGIDAQVITVPRDNLVTAVNTAAAQLAPHCRALMIGADDAVFVTPGWDKLLMMGLDDLGGSGYAYPDDRRRADIPEHCVISSDIVLELGWFAEPSMGHYYIDNVWAELGRRTGLIRYVPQAVVEHRHYSITSGVVRDATYAEAEQSWGDHDLEAFQSWMRKDLPMQTARLRRKFSPDVHWVLGKVLCDACHQQRVGAHCHHREYLHGPAEPVQRHLLEQCRHVRLHRDEQHRLPRKRAQLP